MENLENLPTIFISFFTFLFIKGIVSIMGQWIAHTPPELIAEHLHIDKATLAAIPRDKAVVVPL